MKVKDAFFTDLETTDEEEQLFEAIYQRHLIGNIAYLIVKNGKDAVIAEIDAYLKLKDIKGT